MEKQYSHIHSVSVLKTQIKFFLATEDFQDNTPFTFPVVNGVVMFGTVESASDMLQDLEVGHLLDGFNLDHGVTVNSIMISLERFKLGEINMLHDKNHYQLLPKINGYKWCGYDHANAMHYFTKKIGGEYATCYLTNEDVEDRENLTTMLDKNLSRKLEK